MQATPVEAEVRQRGNLAVVDLRGEVDATGEEALCGAYAEAAARASTVVLNFRDVGYIDSTGLRPALRCGLRPSEAHQRRPQPVDPAGIPRIAPIRLRR